MKVIYSPYEKLIPKQLEDALSLRQRVFIIEQECFYEDIDGHDDEAGHLFFYDGKDLAAYLRVFDAGIKYDDEASIGRIVVDPRYRGTGLGVELIQKGIECCNNQPIRIEAQAALLNYYRELGFFEKSEIYMVDGIEHIQMTYPT